MLSSRTMRPQAEFHVANHLTGLMCVRLHRSRFACCSKAVSKALLACVVATAWCKRCQICGTGSHLQFATHVTRPSCQAAKFRTTWRPLPWQCLQAMSSSHSSCIRYTPTLYGGGYLDVHRSVLATLAVHMCWVIQ